MIPTIKMALLSVCALALMACGTKETTPPDALIATPQGPVQGVSTQDAGFYNFKGLPFAAPPIGALRWSPPQPAATWDEALIANIFGNRCMQSSGAEEDFFNLLIKGHGLGPIKNFLIKRVVAMQKPTPMSEDCLYLNVRTGNLKGKAQQPVMVWIHGGGHQFGSGDPAYYQNNALAQKGIVLVTINYRLGVFGYMAHPALSATDPNGVSGNYGTLDQIAALQWVRDNISAYGGDPDNVTIFGESAGAWSVTELMASPLAKGLFHKAIGQSGASSYHLGQMDEDAPDSVKGWPGGYVMGRKVAQSVGLENPTAAEFRAVPARDIIENLPPKAADAFHHIRDGYVFPKNVGLAFANGSYNKVPTLFGFNSDEATLFFPNDPQPTVWLEDMPTQDRDAQIKALSAAFPTQAETVIDLYNLDTDFTDGGTRFMGDEIFGMNIRYVTRQNEANGQDAYSYFFSRIPPSKKQSLGAFHAAEIGFVFGSHEKALGQSEEDKALSEMMQGYWVNFAKTGNPNGASLPEWQRHQGENWMHFTANTGEASGAMKNIRRDKIDALSEGLNLKLKQLKAAQNPPSPQTQPNSAVSD